MYIRSSNIQTLIIDVYYPNPRFIAAYFYLENLYQRVSVCLSVCLRVIHDDVGSAMGLDNGNATTVVPVLVKTEENSGKNMRRVNIPASHCALKACSLD